MKLKFVALIFLAVLTQGCASFVCRYDYMTASRKAEPTPYFPGVVSDFQGMGCGLTAPFCAPFNEKRELWEFVFFPLCLIDLPFSLVSDVLWIPSDYFYQCAEKNRQLEKDALPNAKP